jgi:hypothetical protein
MMMVIEGWFLLVSNVCCRFRKLSSEGSEQVFALTQPSEVAASKYW